MDVDMKDPFLKDAVPPVWLLASGWIPQDLLTHHFTMFVESALKIRGNSFVPRR